MGYTTTFDGAISVNPPLNAEEIAYLRNFNETCHSGPRLPGSYCQWRPTSNGKFIEWDQGEKSYDSLEWMQYLIDHFLKPGALDKSKLPFLQANHVLSGRIDAQGEDSDDRWRLVVKNNKAYRVYPRVTWPDEDR